MATASPFQNTNIRLPFTFTFTNPPTYSHLHLPKYHNTTPNLYHHQHHPANKPNPTTMAAGSSSSWTSPEALRTNEFVRLKQNAQHLGLSNSPFLPWSEREFEVHKREFGKVKKEEEMVRLRARLEDAEGRKRAGGIRVGVGECMVKFEGKVKDISGLWYGGLAPVSGVGGKFPFPNLEFKPLLTRV
jgi:hypothetical protein